MTPTVRLKPETRASRRPDPRTARRPSVGLRAFPPRVRARDARQGSVVRDRTSDETRAPPVATYCVRRDHVTGTSRAALRILGVVGADVEARDGVAERAGHRGAILGEQVAVEVLRGLDFAVTELVGDL